jgi:hypothetical protein
MEDKSPAACAFQDFNELTKLNFNDWEVKVYRTVIGGGTGEEYPDNLKRDGSSPGNKWYDNNSGETWIEAIFKEPTRIKFLQLKSANDCPNRDPYSFSISVSEVNDSSTYKTIASYDNLIFEERYQVIDFNVDTGVKVDKLKVTIHKNKSLIESGNWGDGTQLAQLILYK